MTTKFTGMIAMGRSMVITEDFEVDHPFVFVIVDSPEKVLMPLTYYDYSFVSRLIKDIHIKIVK